MKMFIDFSRFCSDYGIPIADPGHKHGRVGWISCECPFCTGNPGFHLGYNTASGYFNCWRCGWHPDAKVLETLAHVSWKEAKALILKYESLARFKRQSEVHIQIPFELPSGTLPCTDRHRKYLVKRGYDADSVIDRWNLLGTGWKSLMPFRLIIPISHKGETVSYQGRDITGRSELRYKACPKIMEKVHHKHILYGLDDVPEDWVIIVEGVPSVWRLGPGAVATFGAKFTLSQVRLLQPFKRRYIFFDSDSAGMSQAKKLAEYLSVMRGITEIWQYRGSGKDPGDMSQKEANQLIREMLK